MRELEEYGLVERRVYAEIPTHVEYSLTDKGRENQPVMGDLYQIGLEWLGRDGCACPLDKYIFSYQGLTISRQLLEKIVFLMIAS